MGLLKKFQQRTSTSLKESENEMEKKWIGKGHRKKWTGKFSFKDRNGRTLKKVPWKDEDEWIQYGLEKDFNKANPATILKSEHMEERRWALKGMKEGWVNEFEFDTALKITPWDTYEHWKSYGIANKFHKRIDRGLRNSENKTEVSWYRRGSYRDWIKNFKFRKKKSNNYLSSPEQFTQFLQENPDVANLSVAASLLPGQEYDFEKVSYEMHQEKFKDQQQFHDILESNRDEVYKLAREGYISLGEYIGEFTTENKGIIPVLIGDTIRNINWDKLAPTQQDVFFHSLLNYYSHDFNTDPSEVFQDLEERITKYNGEAGGVFKRVQAHYQGIIDVMEELK